MWGAVILYLQSSSMSGKKLLAERMWFREWQVVITSASEIILEFLLFSVYNHPFGKNPSTIMFVNSTAMLNFHKFMSPSQTFYISNAPWCIHILNRHRHFSHTVSKLYFSPPIHADFIHFRQNTPASLHLLGYKWEQVAIFDLDHSNSNPHCLFSGLSLAFSLWTT
jgi:hypothetical protein